MKRLYILYDHTCGLCSRAAAWIESQPTYFPIDCMARGLERARDRFPTLNTESDELVAISDTGDVYRGHNAWLICLYALKRYRPWSYRLAAPGVRHVARAAIQALSNHRKDLSRLLHLYPTPRCDTSSCSPTNARNP